MLDSQHPRRHARREVGQPQVRGQARQPGQQPPIRHHHRRLGARWRIGRGDARRGSATTSRSSRSTTRRGARTRSPRKAGSTRPRTTRTTATASTACSTTRSRAATTARARRTSTGSRRCRSTSSTSASRRACRSRVSTAGCSTTARFGGAQVSRTFYARGQTGQQLLLGAYQALMRQVHAGTVTLYPRTEMLDLVVKDGRRVRHRVPRPEQRRRVLVDRPRGCARHRWLRQRVLPLDEREELERHRRVAGLRSGAPTWPTRASPRSTPRASRRATTSSRSSRSCRSRCATTAGSGCPKQMDDPRSPDQIPVDDRDYFLERRYPAFGNLVPRDVASRAIKREVDAGRGVGR